MTPCRIRLVRKSMILAGVSALWCRWPECDVIKLINLDQLEWLMGEQPVQPKNLL